jgi:FkbM family methyltransferase
VVEPKDSYTINFVEKELNEGEYNLQAVKKYVLRPGDTVLDLGTNVGLTAMVIAQMNPGVRVIGIEPSPFNYAAAIENIRKHNLEDRVTVIFAALSSHKQPLTLRVKEHNHGGSSTTDNLKFTDAKKNPVIHNYTVQTVTVDEIVHYYNVTKKRTPFIKLDCEGCEYDILPNLSPDAKKIFESAYVVGEVHYFNMPGIEGSDEMKIAHSYFFETQLGKRPEITSRRRKNN